MANIPVISQLENYMALAGQRETVIASNMANVDTPGYRTKDISFQKELARAVSAEQQGSLSDTGPEVRDVQGLLERPDGNNVDIDRESMQLAQVQLQYQMGTQLLKQRFHQLLTAINGDQ